MSDAPPDGAVPRTPKHDRRALTGCERLRSRVDDAPSGGGEKYEPQTPEQARELAVANNRVGAVYDRPLPEDLTRIAGIDQVFEDELYAAGIFTFRQLAERTPDELARIIPAHLAGEELDFVSWIVQADSLRDEYYTDEPPIL